MFHRPAFRQVARRARSFIGAALIVIQPVIAGLALVPQAAHADVASGDIVFEQFQPLTGHSGSYIRKIMKRASDGTQTMISHSSDCEGTYYNVCEDIMPNVSPDGSKVAFVGSRPAGDAPNPATDVEPVLLGVMNSDGSGQTLLHTPQYYFTDPAYPNEYTYQEDLYPSWSPNGRQIAYERDIHDKSYIYKINADGTGDTRLVTGVASFNGTASFPTWSPDGTKIAYSLLDSSNGGTQLYVMNADGTNQHLITGAPSSYLEGMPVWSPDGNRMYFETSQGGTWYYTSTDGFATTTNVISRTQLTSYFSGNRAVDVSADGNTVAFDYDTNSGADCHELWTISSSGGTPTQLTDSASGSSCSVFANSGPRFVDNAWSIKHFAVLGDSYSAGEGNQPFISPSDTDGCHRSEKAYAEVLDTHPSGMSLSEDGFVACAGATTSDVINGMHDESSQLNAITSSDDYVLLTIGGNDVGFPTFARACVFNACAAGSDAYNTIESSIANDLPGNLDALFSQISTLAGSKRVLVLGYPKILPPTGASFTCSGLASGSRSAAQQVTVDLNSAIKTAVASAGAPFEFVEADAVVDNLRVSPFAGHELCSEDPYFYAVNWVDVYSGVNFGDFGFSYHPNEKGQAAYAKLVTDYLASNPNGNNDFVNNGTFESGSVAGWNATNTPTVSTTVAHSGSKSMAFTGSFDVTDSPNSISVSTPVAIDPVDFWAKGPSGKTIRVKLRQYLPGGNNELYQSFTLDGNWDHFTTKSLHLYPGYSLDLNFDNPGASSGDAYYLDDVHEYGYTATETCGYDNLLEGLNADAVENCGGEAPYGTQHWAAADSANPTLTSDTADAYYGLYSFKLVAANSGTMSMNDSPDARDVGEVSTSATSCTATAWMKGPSTAGSRVLKLRIREYNAGTGSLVGTATATATPNGSWQQLSVTRTLGSGHDANTHLDLYAYMTNASANDVVRVDHITETCQ